MIPDYCNKCFLDLSIDGSLITEEDEINCIIVFKCSNCGNVIKGNTNTTNENDGVISYDFVC